LRYLTVAVDFYHDERDALMLEAPRIQRVSTHGTGCTYSAAMPGTALLSPPLRGGTAKTYLHHRQRSACESTANHLTPP
jgi:hydroxymethylpyrimidine/phosphomethylpyrimidine kinase